MREYLLLFTICLVFLGGCNNNPIKGTIWIGENQYYYDVIEFSEDSLIYYGVDIDGEIVVPEIQLPYELKKGDYGIKYFGNIPETIINRPLAFDSIPSYNIISGFRIPEKGVKNIEIYRKWSKDGKKWESEYPDYQSIEFYNNFKPLINTTPREVISNRDYHGLMSILRDRYYIKENSYGAKTKDDYYLLQKYLNKEQFDSIDNLITKERIVKFTDKWLVGGEYANADYVLIKLERGGDEYFVNWNALVNYSDHSTTYHNIETGKSQSSYGGSREQLLDLEMADESLTEYEKSIEAEYEQQVERELREMDW